MYNVNEYKITHIFVSIHRYRYKYNSMYPYFIIVCVTNDIQICILTYLLLYLYE